jgi:2',3'-cyclic-nucleotide 2'-phosphodiesterase (5'-nucleotidase family)
LGTITVGDIITVLPFGNYVVTKEISGADILAALEQGIDSYPEPKGAFPHIAGATLLFDGLEEMVIEYIQSKENVSPQLDGRISAR